MPVKKTRTIVVSEVEKVICDVCGKENIFSFLHLDYQFGYGTEYDTMNVKADICDFCLVDIIKNKMPKVFDHQLENPDNDIHRIY